MYKIVPNIATIEAIRGLNKTRSKERTFSMRPPNRIPSQPSEVGLLKMADARVSNPTGERRTSQKTKTISRIARILASRDAFILGGPF